MRRSYKFILAFILTLCLGLSICLLSFFYPIPAINALLAELYWPWLDYVFAGFCAFIGFTAFILLLVVLFFPAKSNFLIITTDKGRLWFSKKAVESTVRYSFADIKGINVYKTKVKLGKKVKVDIKMSADNTDALASLTEGIQEKISTALESSLNITAKSITVKLAQAGVIKNEPVD